MITAWCRNFWVMLYSPCLQVCCFLPLLWDQFQDIRIWCQHLPHPVHLWRNWSSRQSPDVFCPGFHWPSKWPGLVSDYNRSSDWDKHCHTFRFILLLYFSLMIFIVTIWRNACAWSSSELELSLALFPEYSVVRTCIAVVAKGFSEAAFTTAFLYSAELYPTVLR